MDKRQPRARAFGTSINMPVTGIGESGASILGSTVEYDVQNIQACEINRSYVSQAKLWLLGNDMIYTIGSPSLHTDFCFSFTPNVAALKLLRPSPLHARTLSMAISQSTDGPSSVMDGVTSSMREWKPPLVDHVALL